VPGISPCCAVTPPQRFCTLSIPPACKQSHILRLEAEGGLFSFRLLSTCHLFTAESLSKPEDTPLAAAVGETSRTQASTQTPTNTHTHTQQQQQQQQQGRRLQKKRRREGFAGVHYSLSKRYPFDSRVVGQTPSRQRRTRAERRVRNPSSPNQISKHGHRLHAPQQEAAAVDGCGTRSAG